MKSSRFKKFINLFAQIAPESIKDNSKGILNWGENNNLPQNILKYIYESHTASACLDTFIDFLEGDGFSQKELGTFKVNEKQTLDDLHSIISKDETYLEGFGVLVKYNAFGEKVSLDHLPFECLRLGIPDDTGYISKIYYNPYYGTSDFKENQTISYDVYNPKREVVLSQIENNGEKYNGQVYFFAHEKPLKRFYPEPFFIAGLKWFLIDHKIGTFHERNIDNNFLLSVLFKMVGDPDEALEKDDKGNVTLTVGQAFDNMLSSTLTGADNGGISMVLWSKLKDQFPEIAPFPSNTNHELFTTLQQLTIDNISISTKVPPILANIQVAGKLGNSQEIVNAIKLMYQRVNRKQRALEGAYKELLKDFKGVPTITDLTIRNISPVDVIPPEVWESLTRDEQRKFVENNFDIELIPIDSNVDKGKSLLIERIGVGGANTLVSLVQVLGEGKITREQFISTLEILFGLSRENAEKIAGEQIIKPVTPDTNGM